MVGVVAGAVTAFALLVVALITSGPPTALALLAVILALALIAARRLDAVDLLILAILVVLLLPARYRIEPLGAAGTPGALMGMATFGMWAWGVTFGRPWLARHHHPMRWALALVVLSALISFVAMGFRSHDELEWRAALRGLMTLVSTLGFVLLTADLLRTREDLRRVVAAIVAAGSVIAALGALQFVTGIDLAAIARIPGFAYVPAGYADERAGFVRIVSTTSHPIELSVTLVLLLPLAMWLGFTATGRAKHGWWALAAVIAAAVPLTVSRTGIAGLAVAALVILPGLSWRRRFWLIVAGIGGLVAMRVAVPGLLGTLRSFLFNPGEDPSLISRNRAYDTAWSFIDERPWLGRGSGTFLPERYAFLDNQVLLTLVETGALGLLAWVVVFATGAWLALLARSRRRSTPTDSDRDLALFLLACIAVGGATWLTFDALGFSTSRSLTMIALGLTAALWRIARREPGRPDLSPYRPDGVSPPPRRHPRRVAP